MTTRTVRIGIDNGISGSIGIIDDGLVSFYTTSEFTRKTQDYTKKKQNVTRINTLRLHTMLFQYIGCNIRVMLERPLVNPGMFKATMSAMRCLEATIGVLDLLEFPYEFVDSKEWQRVLLPNGVKGTAELKRASLDIGIRMYPMHQVKMERIKDADGLHIAEFCRRRYQ